MEPVVFAKIFARPSLEETLDAVADQGLHFIQFNLVSAGLPPLPDEIPDGVPEPIRTECAVRGIEIAALSGTFNLAHPDAAVRSQGLARFRVLAAACRAMGASVITICTDTRDSDNMWRSHPENDSPEAWTDLVATLDASLAIAAEHGVMVAFGPEPGNVVRDARRGQALLRELPSPLLAVVIDPANILASGRERPAETVLDEAFDLLGGRIAIVHAKDLGADGKPCAAGKGVVPWDRFIELLRGVGSSAPLILHGLDEDEVSGSVGFLRERIARRPA